MDLQAFLIFAGTAAGAGLIDFSLIEWFDNKVRPLGSTLKYWLSVALGLLIPGVALGVEVAMGWATLTPEAVFSVLVVAWTVSQSIHGTVQAATK
jgi:hypothetical protein